MFTEATKKQLKLRLLLEGASGSGKTLSALILASNLGGKYAVIDTENDSASLYAKRQIEVDGIKYYFVFDRVNLKPPFTPERYIAAIKAAEDAGYSTLIIDSMTHEWSGEGGCLDIQTSLGGKYQDWAKVTPRHKKFIDAWYRSKMHIIGSARTKSDMAMSTENGKAKVSKLGLKTEQRDGLDFEFDVVFRLNEHHVFEVSKDRTHMFGGVQSKIRAEHADQLLQWLQEGEIVVPVIEKSQEEIIQAVIDKIALSQSSDELNSVYRELPIELKKDALVLDMCKNRKQELQTGAQA